MPAFASAGSDAGSLAWTAPAGWTPKSGSAMRKGTYAVGADGGAAADLSITAFPGDVGGETANVNRWRGQIGLPELPDADVPSSVTRLEAAALSIGYVELANGGQRMLAAFVPYRGATWFFKLTGPDAVVAGAKQAYVDFLRTIRPAAVAASEPAAAAVVPAAGGAPLPSPSEMANTAVAKADGPGLKWTAPAHWQSKPATVMRQGSYTVNGADGATADVSITAFPGDVGGELANVNRWRGQLDLPAVTAADIDSVVVRQKQGPLNLTIVDLTGGGTVGRQRMLGAMVPFNGATWFVKLLGPEALVAREKPAFLDFLHTLQAP